MNFNEKLISLRKTKGLSKKNWEQNESNNEKGRFNDEI